MKDKRENRWKKLEDDFAKWDQNQREVKLQRKNEKLLREAKEDGLAQGRIEGQNDTIRTLAKSLSVGQIASILGKSTIEIETILKG